jgi:hypothetical protein
MMARLKEKTALVTDGGRMDFPAGLAMAHQRLDALYGNG